MERSQSAEISIVISEGKTISKWGIAGSSPKDASINRLLLGELEFIKAQIIENMNKKVNREVVETREKNPDE